MNNTKWRAIGEARITLDSDSVASLSIPNLCSSATVAANGGKILYTVLEGAEPDGSFGRPVLDGEEVVLINLDWCKNFAVRRTGEDPVYVYVTFFTYG